MNAESRADHMGRPSHRAQRLIIAATVLVAGAIVLLLTQLVGGRGPGHGPQVRMVEPPAESGPVTLYFSSSDGGTVVSETRDVALPASPSQRVRTLLKELTAGPTGGGARVLPASTSLRGVYLLEDGETLCLDFSNDLRTGLGGGSTNEYLALASILETVRSAMPQVKRVQFLLEGKVVESLCGHYDISLPINLEDWKTEQPGNSGE